MEKTLQALQVNTNVLKEIQFQLQIRMPDDGGDMLTKNEMIKIFVKMVKQTNN